MSRAATQTDPRGGFPITRISTLSGIRSAEEEVRQRSHDLLARAYWAPVHRYLRLRWHAGGEEARDLTQEFFARAISGGYFAAYDPSLGRFRTFLRVCLDRFVANEAQAAARIKRGGGLAFQPIDPDDPEPELASAVDPEELFERDWIRSFYTIVVERLRAECASAGKERHFRIFERYDLSGDQERDRLTYDTLAGELGIRATDVTNHLSFVRRRFRALALETLRELTASDREFEEEARALLGWSPP